MLIFRSLIGWFALVMLVLFGTSCFRYFGFFSVDTEHKNINLDGAVLDTDVGGSSQSDGYASDGDGNDGDVHDSDDVDSSQSDGDVSDGDTDDGDVHDEDDSGLSDGDMSDGDDILIVLEDMVSIIAGEFTMGSPSDEPGRSDDETQHDVRLTHDFLMLSTEVTQDDFMTLMGWNPSNFLSCGADCPVENVTWYDAIAFVNQLSSVTGLDQCYGFSDVVCDNDTRVGASYMECYADEGTPGGIYSATVDLFEPGSIYDCEGYRLPTEAEWEYVVRAGTTESTYRGNLDADHLVCEQPNAVLDDIAWFCGNSMLRTHESGIQEPNDWGFYDMFGNVWEWCHDWYSGELGDTPSEDPEGASVGSSRVQRGGSWHATGGFGRFLRSAFRGTRNPSGHAADLGFRVVRSSQP